MSQSQNEQIFSENLKYYMELNNISRYAICNALNLRYTTFSGWYNGKIYPRIDKLEELANFFNIKKSDLIEKREDTIHSSNSTIEVPLLRTIKDRDNYLSQENWIGTVFVEKKLAKNNNLFALKVKGDSMFPILIENDIVIVKKQDDFKNGDIVVAIVNNKIVIHKGKKSTIGILLQPLNTSYEPVIYTYDDMKTIPVTILGIVTQLKRDF